jgi:hypothetical protein
LEFGHNIRIQGRRSDFAEAYYLWTNGQAERMNRTVKEATVRAFHYETLDSLKAHLDAFITAYSFAKHLKSLRWQTPFQAICDARTKDPTPFIINPHHVISGTTHLGAPINPSGWLV